MSMELGLNSAISGLLTAQRGLDVVSNNISNANTVGYTRKIMNTESVVLGGWGAGTQIGSITRSVDEGLLKDLRNETGNTKQLSAQSDVYNRLQQMFGTVEAGNSIANSVDNLSASWQALAGDTGTASVQQSTIQAAVNTTNQISALSAQIQAQRLASDVTIGSVVTDINTQLSNVADLNDKIVRNTALGLSTGDLEDKRDTALTALSGQLDIQYFKRSDGAMVIYTNAGQPLLDKQAATLTHSPVSVSQSWMTQSGGDFQDITVGGVKITAQIASGQLKGLIDLRDTILPNLQSELDQMSQSLQQQANLIHNRGTAFPQMATSYTGSRTFIAPASQTVTFDKNSDTVLAVMDSTGKAVATTTVRSLMQDPTNSVTSVAAAIQTWMQGAIGTGAGLTNATCAINGTGNLAINTNDSNFSFVMRDQTCSHDAPPTYDSKQQTAGYTAAGGDLTFSSSGGLTTAYTLPVAGGQSLADIRDAILADPTLRAASVSASVETGTGGSQYLRITDTNGEALAVTGSQATALGIVRSDPATTVADATINFDVDGTGATVRPVSGFSNFFGLNDFFVTNHPTDMYDSTVQASNFKTTGLNTVTIRDSDGLLGGRVTVGSNSSLADIAKAINNNCFSYDSAQQANFTGAAGATLSLSRGATALVPASNVDGAGNFALNGGETLSDVATELNAAYGAQNITASVVSSGSNQILRVVDSTGALLNISGTLATNTLKPLKTANLRAEVVPEASGARLRVIDNAGKEVVLSGTMVQTLGMAPAACNTGTLLGVRADLKTQPAQVSRGMLQYSTDQKAYYLSPGDNTSALAMSTMMNGQVTIPLAGNLPAGSASFSQYASSIIAQNSQDASSLTDKLSYQSNLTDNLEKQRSGKSDVNLDEEMSALIVWQQSYAAAAKIISTTQSMFQTLTDMMH